MLESFVWYVIWTSYGLFKTCGSVPLFGEIYSHCQSFHGRNSRKLKFTLASMLGVHKTNHWGDGWTDFQSILQPRQIYSQIMFFEQRRNSRRRGLKGKNNTFFLFIYLICFTKIVRKNEKKCFWLKQCLDVI